MSLAQFAANYTYKRESNNDAMLHSDDGSEQSGTELTSEHPIQHQSIITLQNGLGCMRKRKQKAIIRWHNFNIEKEAEKHFRSRIMLFLPWRDENKLHAKYTSYADRYHHEIEKIKKVEDEFIHHEEEINEAFKEFATVGPPQES